MSTASPDELQLDPVTLSVGLHGQRRSLTAAEFRVLEALKRRPHRALSREELAQAITQDQAVIGERTVDVHICSLRRKLRPATLIYTVRNIGYALGAPSPSG